MLAALHAFKAAGRQAAGQSGADLRGRGGDRLAPFQTDATRPDMLAALKKCEGIFIPAGWQNKQGAVDVNLGVEGHHRAGADRQRREMGARAEAGHSFQPEGDGRFPRVAAGPRARDAGDAGRQHADHRRLVRECAATDRAPEGADRRKCQERTAKPTQKKAWASITGSTICPMYRHSNGSPRSRPSISKGWSRAIPAPAARPCCPRARSPRSTADWSRTRPARKRRGNCARTSTSAVSRTSRSRSAAATTPPRRRRPAV